MLSRYIFKKKGTELVFAVMILNILVKSPREILCDFQASSTSGYVLLSYFFLLEFDFGSLSFGANLLHYKEIASQPESWVS